MTRLADTHPQVYQHMTEGGLSVQLGIANPFGRIPVDQTIEETANRDTQTKGFQSETWCSEPLLYNS